METVLRLFQTILLSEATRSSQLNCVLSIFASETIGNDCLAIAKSFKIKMKTCTDDNYDRGDAKVSHSALFSHQTRRRGQNLPLGMLKQLITFANKLRKTKQIDGIILFHSAKSGTIVVGLNF